MSTEPLVSIGMPIFNGIRYVRTAIDSIVGQSYRNIEIVISDNASSDGTGEIAAEYATRDPRVVYLRQETNRGGGWNFNFVLERARGPYFMWAAVDDWRSVGSVAAMVAALEGSPSTVTAGTPYILVDTTGATMGEPLVPMRVDSTNAWERVRSFAFHPLAGAYTYGLQRTHVARGYKFKPFVFLPKTTKGMEHPFLCYLASVGSLVTVPDEMMFLRVRPDSDGSRPESALVHLAARTQVVGRTAHAVWRGSKSLQLASKVLAMEAGAQIRQVTAIAPRWVRKTVRGRGRSTTG